MKINSVKMDIEDLERLLYFFLRHCDADAMCGVYLEQFHGKEKEIIHEYIDRWINE